MMSVATAAFITAPLVRRRSWWNLLLEAALRQFRPGSRFVFLESVMALDRSESFIM